MSELDSVLIGVVGRPHGLRGEVTVALRTDEPMLRFAPGQAVRVGRAPRTVATSRWHGGLLLVAFADAGGRSGAEALRGLEIWADVPADEEPAGTDEFYDRHLVGLEVRDAAGAAVGTVAAVEHGPSQDLLVVAMADGERRVPFVSALVPVVDVADGFLQVADVPGLLDDEAL